MPAKRENDYYVVGETAFIDISTEMFPLSIVVIDKADIALVLKGRRWTVGGNRNRRYTRYAVRRIGSGGNQTTEAMARVIVGVRDSAVLVDHRDGDGLNNRRLNLRICTSLQNQANRTKNSSGSSKYKGVTKDRRSGAWVAQSSEKNKHIYLGSFDSEIEAANAYDEYALNRFGEFSKLNFDSEERT